MYIYKKSTKFIKITNIYLPYFQKICQCVIKLQTKIQITQQHNKSKLKNTFRLREIIAKRKI